MWFIFPWYYLPLTLLGIIISYFFRSDKTDYSCLEVIPDEYIIGSDPD
jgi:hypothetical protein